MILILILSVAASDSCAWSWPFGKKTKRFDTGRLLVTQGKYEDGIGYLEAYLEKNPNGVNASRARFFIAKAYIGMGKLETARLMFMETIEMHPDSDEAKKSRYKLAMIDLWQGNIKAAKDRLYQENQILDNPLAPESNAMLKYLDQVEKGAR